MNKKNYITYFIIKMAAFTVLAILVLIFKDQHVENLKPFIGALMALYGVEGMLFELLFHRHHFFHEGKTYLGLIELIFGLVVILATDLKFEYVCIIWATWSIIRESHEFEEIVCEIKSIAPKILSGTESVVVIVFSILLILNPGEHHAHIHMILLVIELILSPLVILLDEFIINYVSKKKQGTKNPLE